MSEMLRLDGVCKSYPMDEERVQVLRKVSLAVEAGEFVSILGASGSGKSTLMNIIGCMDSADEGSYRLEGEDVFALDPRQLAALRNRKIGFIFQRYHLLPQYDVLQNVMMPLLVRGVPHGEAERLAREELAAMGLQERLKHRPNQLSGGQQQRVATGRALMGRPALLLADEPTGALDAATGREILGLFRQLNRQGHTILQITHDLTVASAAGRILHLRDGVLTSQ